jgi:hypothetical protein
MKHLKTHKQLNEASENLNISDVMNSLLKDLEQQLNDSKSMTMSYDDREMVYRDGVENGLEQSIDLLKEYISKYCS